MGQSQRVGDWDITILSINPDAWSVVRAENQFNDPPSPGFQYVMFRVSATYRGTDTGSAWLDLNWAIVGTSGNTFDEGTEYACGVIPDEMYDVGDLYPDATAEANVCVAVQSAQLNGAAIRLQAGFFGDEVFFRTDGNGPGTTPGPIGGLTPGFLALTVEQIDWLGTISDDLDAITSAGDPWRPRLLRPAVTDALQNSQDIQTWLTGNTPDDACYSGLYIAWSLFINEWVDGLDKVDYGLLPPITYDDVNDGLEQLVGALDLFDNIEPAMNATTCI